MFKKLKEKFYNEEFKKLKELWETLEDWRQRMEKDIEDKEKDLKKKQNLIEKESKENYRIQFQKEIERNLGILWDIKKYNILPWHKVWGIEPFTNGIKEFTITSIVITQDDIKFYSDGLWIQKPCQTRWEAVNAYNDKLNSMKIN